MLYKFNKKRLPGTKIIPACANYGLYDGPGPFLLGNMEVASVEANIHPKPIMYEISSIYYKMGDTASAREWMDRYDSFPE